MSVLAIVLLLGTFQSYGTSSYKDDAYRSTAAATSGYELLADGSIHKGTTEPHAGFFVKGRIRNGRFVPRGEVRGHAGLSTSGHPGWLELYDGTFYGDETARKPRPPYIRGYKDSAGKFVPSSRQLVY